MEAECVRAAFLGIGFAEMRLIGAILMGVKKGAHYGNTYIDADVGFVYRRGISRRRCRRGVIPGLLQSPPVNAPELAE
jgi:hypothetical protein